MASWLAKVAKAFSKEVSGRICTIDAREMELAQWTKFIETDANDVD